MDLISCRNLMIYLGPELQDRVIALLHYALKEPGFLLLGSAETVHAFAGFAPVDGKNKIYARTSAAPRLAFDFTSRPPLDADSARSAAGAGAPLTGGITLGPADVHREADRLVLAEFAPPGLVVTEDLAVVQFRGRTGPFLEHAPGVASLHVLRTAREELRLPLRRALDLARSTSERARETGIAFLVGEQRRTVALEIIPFSLHATGERFFLVLFEDTTPEEAKVAEPEPPPGSTAAEATESGVQKELASTREYLGSVIEQLEATNEELQAANEEVVSNNEELRSTNEELQNAKEELQATNEELRTVNDEMRDRSAEATRLSEDLTNVLTSTEIPILLVGRDFRLRRFTPSAGRMFGLLPTDLGRSVSDVPRVVAIGPSLTGTMAEVLEQLRPSSSDVEDASGRRHELTVRPYVTLDGRVDGTVVALHDVDAERRSAERVEAARAYAQGVVDAVRDGLVVLDRDLRVSSANQAFLRTFGLSADGVSGRRLEELGQPELAAPALSTLLGQLAPSATLESFRLERDGADGAHTFLLNAHHIEGSELRLLTFEDVTLAERARASLQFREVVADSAEGVLMVDAAGRITFVNRAASEMFGYEREELLGLSVELLVPLPMRDVHATHRADYMTTPTLRQMGQGRQLRGQRKDGTELPIEVTLSAVMREGGPVIVAFVRDITERRAAEQRIRAYQDELQRMSFDAAVTEERERRRLAIELHDHLGQTLALATIKLTSVRADLGGETRAAVDGTVELLEQAISDARALIFELSPPILYDLGLKEALAWLAEDLEKRHGIKIEVSDDGAKMPLDDATKGVLFRAVRELLVNVLKHAKAPTAKVSLKRAGDDVLIDVEDNGAGFDPEAPSQPRTDGGFGLLSVRSQLTRLGGLLKLQSAPGRGTLASLRVPLQTSAPERDDRASPDQQETP